MKGRKIPKIIHMINKSKYVTKTFANNIKLWRFQGHLLFLNDNHSVDRLFNKDLPAFPLLKHGQSCLSSGSGLAYLCRYLIMWKYCGVYTDMDDITGNLDDGTMVSDGDDDFLRWVGLAFHPGITLQVSFNWL